MASTQLTIGLTPSRSWAKAARAKTRDVERVTHLLIATDGSAGASAAVDYAANVLVKTFGVDQVTLLAVFRESSFLAHDADMDLLPQHTWDELRCAARDEAEDALRRASVALGRFSGRLRTIAKPGRAAQQITRTARELGADMVVIGSYRWGTLRALLLGSVEHSVIDQSPCPVLVIPARSAA
jgi:nucleotide-binding universal stress UspA family protein